MNEVISSDFPKSPDGGWGWIVVFASFMIHVIADGVTYTFGIFYVEFLKYFGTSKATTAWVASIMTGTTYCVGPIASGLTNKYGCRSVTIIGSLFASFGLILSLFASNIIWLYFTIGICTGLGFGLMYLPAIVSVTCYFEKKRAFATGIAVCGSGLGSAILAPLIEWLINIYGWKGAMLIISGLILNCCVCGALFRPIEYIKIQEDNLDKKIVKKTTKKVKETNSKAKPNNCIKITLSQPELELLTIDNANNHTNYLTPSNELDRKRFSTSLNHVNEINSNNLSCNSRLINESVSLNSIQVSTSDSFQSSKNNSIFNQRRRSFTLSPRILNRKDIFYSGSLINIPQYKSNPIIFTLPKQQTIDESKEDWLICKLCHCSNEIIDVLKEMMDFNLLTNVIFLIFAISNFLTSIGFFVPHIYIKDRVVGLKISSDEKASWLLSIIGISSTLGRLIFGFISDHQFINRLWLYNISLTFCGLVTILSSFGKTYWFMALYCASFGLSCGTYVSLTSVILVDLLGIEKLTNAFGILLLFQGIASFIGPPIIGWLYDVTGTYDTGFYVAGSMISISGFMLFFITFAKYYKSIQKSLIIQSPAAI